MISEDIFTVWEIGDNNGSGAFEGQSIDVTALKNVTFKMPAEAPSFNDNSCGESVAGRTINVTIQIPSGHTGYDTSWEAGFKDRFGTNAAVTLNYEDWP